MRQRIITWVREQKGFLVCVCAPLAVAVLVNAIVRPKLAGQLGGRRRAWSNTRGSDNWYEFPPETQRDHPLLTGFLSWHDSAVAMIALGSVVVLCLGWAALGRLTRRRARRRAGH
ncbi:hypothetical protein [Arthrobacter woluwensis]|uniref:Uncharacterized protein n=2 Tax=Arthrobacter woluwensis TaxID=156980 RepID=A0A1H4LSS6_9MICC|nr:hypothetical protein [Arthrobacter woluwensis]SEB73315.1 hypothetical protein SAMN04489745_1099 [Arthrobacter woluwensis]